MSPGAVIGWILATPGLIVAAAIVYFFAWAGLP